MLEASIALGDNPRTRAILDGRVGVQGLRLFATSVHPSEMFWRQLRYGDFDISEMSLATLFIALRLFSVPFAEAQLMGAVVAMTSNFILNNFLTYRDQRLKGFALIRGLLLFYLVCSVGLFANVGVAFSVYDQEPIWWLAGAAGALMGVVWNYAMSGLFVWRKR